MADQRKSGLRLISPALTPESAPKDAHPNKTNLVPAELHFHAAQNVFFNASILPGSLQEGSEKDTTAPPSLVYSPQVAPESSPSLPCEQECDRVVVASLVFRALLLRADVTSEDSDLAEWLDEQLRTKYPTDAERIATVLRTTRDIASGPKRKAYLEAELAARKATMEARVGLTLQEFQDVTPAWKMWLEDEKQAIATLQGEVDGLESSLSPKAAAKCEVVQPPPMKKESTLAPRPRLKVVLHASQHIPYEHFFKLHYGSHSVDTGAFPKCNADSSRGYNNTAAFLPDFDPSRVSTLTIEVYERSLKKKGSSCFSCCSGSAVRQVVTKRGQGVVDIRGMVAKEKPWVLRADAVLQHAKKGESLPTVDLEVSVDDDATPDPDVISDSIPNSDPSPTSAPDTERSLFDLTGSAEAAGRSVWRVNHVSALKLLHSSVPPSDKLSRVVEEYVGRYGVRRTAVSLLTLSTTLKGKKERAVDTISWIMKELPPVTSAAATVDEVAIRDEIYRDVAVVLREGVTTPLSDLFRMEGKRGQARQVVARYKETTKCLTWMVQQQGLPEAVEKTDKELFREWVKQGWKSALQQTHARLRNGIGVERKEGMAETIEDSLSISLNQFMQGGVQMDLQNCDGWHRWNRSPLMESIDGRAVICKVLAEENSRRLQLECDVFDSDSILPTDFYAGVDYLQLLTEAGNECVEEAIRDFLALASEMPMTEYRHAMAFVLFRWLVQLPPAGVSIHRSITFTGSPRLDTKRKDTDRLGVGSSPPPLTPGNTLPLGAMAGGAPLPLAMLFGKYLVGWMEHVVDASASQFEAHFKTVTSRAVKGTGMRGSPVRSKIPDDLFKAVDLLLNVRDRWLERWIDPIVPRGPAWEGVTAGEAERQSMYSANLSMRLTDFIFTLMDRTAALYDKLPEGTPAEEGLHYSVIWAADDIFDILLGLKDRKGKLLKKNDVPGVEATARSRLGQLTQSLQLRQAAVVDTVFAPQYTVLKEALHAALVGTTVVDCEERGLRQMIYKTKGEGTKSDGKEAKVAEVVDHLEGLLGAGRGLQYPEFANRFPLFLMRCTMRCLTDILLPVSSDGVVIQGPSLHHREVSGVNLDSFLDRITAVFKNCEIEKGLLEGETSLLKKCVEYYCNPQLKQGDLQEMLDAHLEQKQKDDPLANSLLSRQTQK
eukprot:Sspe_Gene.45810::Locus_22753_Transcript_1_1_Confidence_1.000_Length_3558::g.45810::m.45810